jgi:hypothetical protein
MSLRGLDFDRFFHCIEPEYFVGYFASLEVETRLSVLETMNADALKRFLDHPDNRVARDVILEDFRRIDDISRRGTGLLVRAYDRAGMTYDQNLKREQQGMRLFVENRDAFEFAWARHLFYSSTSKLTVHHVTLPDFKVTPRARAAMEEELRAYFSSQAKGDRCKVRAFDDQGQTLIQVAHGSYIRTVAYWEGDTIAFQTFRPAAEDILVIDEGRSLVEIKASLLKDRKKYLDTFARIVLKNESVIEEAERSQVFTLTPLQDGFDYTGNGEDVLGVTLLKIRMNIPTASRPVIEVRSSDIKWTFDGELGDLRLTSGDLIYAKFRFHLRLPDNSTAKVTFELEPPARTDLIQKTHAAIVERYLEAQRVKVA